LKVFTIPEQDVRKYKEMTNGKVKLAIDFLNYDKKYHKAIASVFGSTFIAEDKATARKVALDNNGMRNYNCVTVDGDMYRSDGTLSGGADTSRPILRSI
jgi:chromosome segregation ATPase